MKIEEPHIKHEFENMLPLVNVVFLLLIYFMVAGAFTTPDLLKINMPFAQSELVADRAVLTILMDKSGRLAIDKQQIEKEMLPEIIQRHIESNEYTKVQLKADANVEALLVVELVELIGKTNLQAIHLLTTSSAL